MLLQGDFVQTDGSEYALKEALYTKGPMTVSVDAGPDSFVFYSSGIYNNSACKSDYKGEHLFSARVLLVCMSARKMLATFNSMFCDMQHRSVVHRHSCEGLKLTVLLGAQT